MKHRAGLHLLKLLKANHAPRFLVERAMDGKDIALLKPAYQSQQSGSRIFLPDPADAGCRNR